MTHLHTLLISAISALCLLSFGCNQEESSIEDDSALFESEKKHMATETIRKMLDLVNDGNWPDLIKEHYGEYHKITNSKQMGQLQNAFEHGMGRELAPVLEQILVIEPVIEGDKALFQINGETIYQLYWEDDQRWAFHL